jgi:hypothetical protein
MELNLAMIKPMKSGMCVTTAWSIVTRLRLTGPLDYWQVAQLREFFDGGVRFFLP